MRIRRLGWACFCTWLALAAILAAPRPAAAQCGMMGTGDHPSMHKESRKPSATQKRLQQSIDLLLSEEQGRTMLADALLNDRAFVEDFMRRLAMIPEWRSLAVRQLAASSADDTVGTTRPESPSAASGLYACPMHPEVTSSKAGECPKCGMQLVRSAPISK